MAAGTISLGAVLRDGRYARSSDPMGRRAVRRLGLDLQIIQPRRIKMTKLDRTDAPATHDYATIHVVFELSKSKWKLGIMLPSSQKLSRYTIAGGDLNALASRLADARVKAARAGQAGSHRVVLRGRFRWPLVASVVDGPRSHHS